VTHYEPLHRSLLICFIVTWLDCHHRVRHDPEGVWGHDHQIIACRPPVDRSSYERVHSKLMRHHSFVRLFKQVHTNFTTVCCTQKARTSSGAFESSSSAVVQRLFYRLRGSQYDESKQERTQHHRPEESSDTRVEKQNIRNNT